MNLIAFNFQPGGYSVTVLVEKMKGEYIFTASRSDKLGIARIITSYAVKPARLARWHQDIPADLGVDIIEREAQKCARIAAKCPLDYDYFQGMITDRWPGMVKDNAYGYRRHVHHLQNSGQVGAGRRAEVIGQEWLR